MRGLDNSPAHQYIIKGRYYKMRVFKRIFKTKRYVMGYRYIGAQVKRTRYGCFKIGETARSIEQREREIKQREASFEMLGYIAIPNVTKPMLLAVEALVRLKLSFYDEYGHTQNDHFVYNVTDREKDLQKIKNQALDIARKACEWLEFEYIG